MTLRNWRGEGMIVTGGASGLGAASAEKLASEGLSVMIFDLDEETGSERADVIGAGFACVDVGCLASVAQGLEAAKDVVGIPRILVNCA